MREIGPKKPHRALDRIFLLRRRSCSSLALNKKIIPMIIPTNIVIGVKIDTMANSHAKISDAISIIFYKCLTSFLRAYFVLAPIRTGNNWSEASCDIRFTTRTVSKNTNYKTQITNNTKILNSKSKTICF